MILHPGILALLSGSVITLIIVIAASLIAVRILRRWDRDSGSEEQLTLERRTWLVSALLNYAFAFQIGSAVLFVFTAEDIHPLFIGAMCATGSLNANLVGWLVLLLKGLLLFIGALWLLFNSLDQSTEDTPLVRVKYRALLVIAPLVALDLYLQWSYFSGLQPEVITSCCGSLFSSQGDSVVSELAGMPPRQAMGLFAVASLVYLGLLAACYRFRSAILRHLLFAATVIMFFVSLGGVVSFISLYIYQMPSHHCPFDMLQGYYYFVGYPLYAGLFVATVFGLIPGLSQPYKRYPSLAAEIERREPRWLVISGCGYLLFLFFPLWQMLFGPFKLLGY